MTDQEYDNLWNRIGNLSPKEQKDLLAEFARRMRAGNHSRRSIMELAGLGKEIWEGIDAQDYVNQERDSWDE